MTTLRPAGAFRDGLSVEVNGDAVELVDGSVCVKCSEGVDV